MTEVCQYPPPLTEDDLSALIDGEEDDQLKDHVRRCPYCAARLEQAGQIEGDLSMTLYRGTCPDSFTLGQYQMDMLEDPEQRATIAGHLDHCPHCRQDLKEWADFIDEDEFGELENQAARSEKVIPMPTHPGNRIVLFPTVAAPSKRAVRGTARTHRIIASAGTTTIRLAFDPLPHDHTKLTIQLASKSVDWRGAMITVRQNEEVVAVCAVNEYQTGTCELTQPAPVSLYFVAADETIIEFGNISPLPG